MNVAKETLGSAEYWLKNFHGEASIIKTVFLRLRKIPLSSPGKISPNKGYPRTFYISSLQRWGLKRTEKMRTEDSNNKYKNCKTFHRRTYIGVLQSATVLVLSWKFQKQPSLCLPLLVKVYYCSMTDVQLNNGSPHKKLFFESLFFNKKLRKNSLLC